MDIPQNDYANTEKERVEKACKTVLTELAGHNDYWMTWSNYPQWLAEKVARLFIEKGYHAATCDHMRGNGPSWFWYGIVISKSPLSYRSTPKSETVVIG